MANLQWIDTHCHIYAEEFSADRHLMVHRAIDAGIRKCLMPNVDVASIDAMLELERDFPDHCIAMMGLHPCSVKDDYEAQLEVVRDWLGVRKFLAIGEIGLDFYWDLTHTEEQYDAFRRQLKWSIEHQVPVVIHSRESLRQCINVVGETGNGRIRGIFHCFGGSADEAREITALGMYLGIGGVLTFKNSGLPEVIKEIGLDRIVLETDAPYLAPVPFRGKRNEPAYITYVAETLAKITGKSMEEIANITTTNAYNIFLPVTI
jgi:TatD DNase family protein